MAAISLPTGPPTNSSDNVFPPGAAWDSGIVHVLQGYVRDEAAGVVRMWKLGSPARHGQQDMRQGVPVPLGVSRLEILPDRWASVSTAGGGRWPPSVLQTDAAPGDAQLITKPVALPTSARPLRLCVNLETANSAELRVEVQNQHGLALPNRSAQDSMPIVGNFLNATVRWGTAEAALLPPGASASVVQLRFTMRGQVSLFSWWFESAAAPGQKTDDAACRYNLTQPRFVMDAALPGGSSEPAGSGRWLASGGVRQPCIPQRWGGDADAPAQFDSAAAGAARGGCC